MRHAILVFTLVLAAGFGGRSLAAGTKSTEAKPVESAATKGEKAKADAKQTARAIEDYAYAQKAEFVADMKKELATIQADLDRLAAKVEKSGGTARTDAKAKLDAGRTDWARAKKQLDRAESATDATWNDVRASFKAAYSDLKLDVDGARQWLSDKIAP
jgi:capsule polysaccharide export protein KpsE/RkpR